MQHLLLLMVAPPLLVSGQPMTLLLHASRNPLHTWAKRAAAVAPGALGDLAAAGDGPYAATVVGTHLTSFMSYVESNERSTRPSTSSSSSSATSTSCR